MSPKEKANELFDKMYSVKTMYNAHNITIHEAKQCTLIAVDEIINQLTPIEKAPNNLSAFNFWQEVKQEIELL